MQKAEFTLLVINLKVGQWWVITILCFASDSWIDDVSQSMQVFGISLYLLDVNLSDWYMIL